MVLVSAVALDFSKKALEMDTLADVGGQKRPHKKKLTIQEEY